MADLSTVQQLIGKLSIKSELKGKLEIPPFREIDEYEGDYTITPSTSEITLETAGKKAVSDIVVEPMPSGSVGNASVSRTKSGGSLVTQVSFPNFTNGYIASISSVTTAQTLEEVTVTPTGESQTITPSSVYDYLNSVTVEAINPEYIGDDVPRQVATQIYPSTLDQIIPAGTYLEGNVTVKGMILQNKTATPTEDEQEIEADLGYDALGSVTVEAIDSEYIGSDIERRYSTDLTSSGATVTAPSGYYESNANFTVPSGSAYISDEVVSGAIRLSVDTQTTPPTVIGQLDSSYEITPTVVEGYVTQGTSGQIRVIDSASYELQVGTVSDPVATKGTVSNHSVSVTPSVSVTSGWVTGSSKTGTAVTVSASELVSGTKSITENGTGIDVTNYESVDVAVPTVQPTLQTKSVTYTPSKTQQTDTVEPDSGYDGLDAVNVTVNAVPMANVESGATTRFYTENSVRKWKVEHSAYAERQGWVDEGEQDSDTIVFSAVPLNTSVSPTELAQTVGGVEYMMEGAVTVNAIPSNYVGTGITRRSSSDMQYGANYSIIAPSGYYPDSASVSIPFYAHLEPYITVNDSTGQVEASHTVVPDTIITGNAVTRSYIQLTVGNNLEYGLTDGTLPLVGVAKIGEAVLFETSPLIGTAQAGYTTVV